MNKRGFEFSFTWLFAIIVGAVIIFIAIFAATNFIQSSRLESDAKVAEQLGILLNPVETNLEDARYAVISFPTETRFISRCRETGNFGRQIISTSLKSGLGEEFTSETTENFFFNKYIFSEEQQDVKELYLLVKPFEMPYKTADLIFAYSDEYCFVNPSSEIKEDIESLNPAKINISDSDELCPRNSVRVCFNSFSGNCDISVDLNRKSVEKEEEILYYEGELVYGAIFSAPEIYECQIKRLMKRSSELAYLYAAKSDFLQGKGCSSSLGEELRRFAVLGSGINSSAELDIIANEAENLRRRNENLICGTF